MIFEAIQHILTPAKKEVKALGYVREAIAIEARYRRCRAAWANHLEKCQHHILAATQSLPLGSTLMIIGSGALHDVPMEDLLARGYRLILVDIIHLPKIRRRYQNHDRIQVIEQDVTGLVENLSHRRAVSKIEPDLPKADFVISLNILSQLSLNLIKYAATHHISLPDDFAKSIMLAHLGLLKTIAPQILIIGDLERRYEKGDKLLEKESALSHMAFPTPIDEWDWYIAPKGELDKEISLTHHVACWRL